MVHVFQDLTEFIKAVSVGLMSDGEKAFQGQMAKWLSKNGIHPYEANAAAFSYLIGLDQDPDTLPSGYETLGRWTSSGLPVDGVDFEQVRDRIVSTDALGKLGATIGYKVPEGLEGHDRDRKSVV